MVEDKEELFELQMVAILAFVLNISEIFQNKSYLLKAKIFERLDTEMWQINTRRSQPVEGLKETPKGNKFSLSNGTKNLFLIWKYYKFSGLWTKSLLYL